MRKSKIGDFVIGAVAFAGLSYALALPLGFLRNTVDPRALAILVVGVGLVVFAVRARRPFLIWGAVAVVAVPAILLLLAWFACMNADPKTMWRP